MGVGSRSRATAPEVFTANTGYALYVMDADGRHQRRLTYMQAEEGLPAWSPDGRRIAFASNRDGNSEVYVMHADGSHQRRLTRHPASDAFPAWSPDGKRIAFLSAAPGRPRCT